MAKGTPAWTRGPKVGVVPLYARVLAFESTVRTCLGALMAEAREGEEVDADAPTTSRYFLGGDCDVLQWSFQVAEAVVGREGVPAPPSGRGGQRSDFPRARCRARRRAWGGGWRGTPRASACTWTSLRL